MSFYQINTGQKYFFNVWEGSVFIDPATGDVLWLIRIADLPAKFPVRSATTTIELSFIDVGGRSYLLPSLAQIELGTSALETRNEVRFLD